MQNVHIKCYKCGEFNSNAQRCVYCEAILDITQRRLIEREKKHQEIVAQQKLIAPTKVELWISSALHHPNIIIRFTARFIKNVYMVVMAIGMFIAWLVSMLLA